MAKLPRWMKIDAQRAGKMTGKLYFSFSVRWWYWPVLYIKVFWKLLTVK